MVRFLCGRSVFRVIYLFYCFAREIRVSLCVGIWQHDWVEIIANVPLHSRFPLRSHTQLPFLTGFPKTKSSRIRRSRSTNWTRLLVTDNNYRPDLTKAALARLSAVNRSLKVAKSGAKKWNRQALKNNFEVDYGSKEHVAIVFAALDVDKELQSDKVKRQMSILDGRLIVKILHGERMGRNQPYRFIKMLEYCSLWHYAKRYWENGTVRLAYRHVHMNTLDDEVKSFPSACLLR